MADFTIEELRAAVTEYGSQRRAAIALGIPRSTLGDRLRAAPPVDENGKPLYAGRVGAHKPIVRPLPVASEVNRYILTVAQNNTALEPSTWNALTNVAKHYDAEIIVSSITYNRNAFAKINEKIGADRSAVGVEGVDEWFPAEVRDFILDEDIQLAPTLMFAGRLNVMPTAPRPLNGFDSYTGEASMIIPHMRQHVRSVPTMKFSRTKILYSTGTVTQRNYIERTTGQKADFHHTYGGLLVEVTHEGKWFVRQLNVDKNGIAYDLDLKFMPNGDVAYDHVEAINWGDIHAHKLSDEVIEASAEMLDAMEPRYQFLHDVLDFYSRNHHHIHDTHTLFRKWHKKAESVEGEVRDLIEKLKHFKRDFTKSVVIESNHDQALTRWLKSTDYKKDPVNAIFYLEAELAIHKAIISGDEDFHTLEWAYRFCGGDSETYFVREDESFVICPEHGGGIECGLHGHRGPNGRFGSPEAFSKMERRTNTGHTHSASMTDGNACAGVSGNLDMGYNVGLSSWSHSHVITYRNGKRTIVTQWDSDWRA